jgi:VanZ family protein
LITIALIVYGSLYPWEFHTRQLGASPLWVMLHSWPSGMNRYLVWDIVVNLALYMPLGVFGFLAVGEAAPRAARLFAPLLLALVLSVSVETIQLFDDSREGSASDVVVNFAGAALGVALGAWRREKLWGALQRRETASLLSPSGELLLFCCWLGYQVFPLFPAIGRAKLVQKLAALGPLSAISPVGTLLVFAEWLAVACLLENIRGSRAGRMLPRLLLVVPGRLVIAGRTLAWSDIAGAAAACAVLLWAPRHHVRRAAPLVLAAALLLAELAPFHLMSARRFNWAPFRGLLESSRQNGLVVLLRKSFWYGSVIWLWRARGYPLALTAAGTAAALLLLEWVQVYLPGRVPEITDAFLAVLMGVLLWLLGDGRYADQAPSTET